ncbi:MAG: STT3 domain-containing protein [Candidatus Aenigmatarchaeota archaeon]
MITMKIPKIGLSNLIIACLLLITIYLAIFTRTSTINTPTVLDYDPWWFYRYAKMILEYGFKLPKWDIQSFSFPGRPIAPFHGWAYTIVFFHKIMNLFSSVDFMKTAILSPLIMVALIPISAFLLGRLLSNNLGGLVTALFAVLTPSFIGVSMAGYCDSDAPVVFYFFFSVFATLLALKNPKPIHILFAVLANLLFVWNWGGGWLTLILFTVFIFILPFFHLFEEFINTSRLKFDFRKIIEEIATVGQPIFLITVITSLISYFIFDQTTEFTSFFSGLAFTGLGLVIRIFVLLVLLVWSGSFAYHFLNLTRKEMNTHKRLYSSLCLFGSILIFYFIFQAFMIVPEKPLIVNVSVAELQPINIFTREGFVSVASRIGVLPTFLSFGLFGLAFYKIWKKEKISMEEVFFFFWLLTMFLLISRGVRFSLQFSIAAAVAGGYVIANYKKYPTIVLSIILVGLFILQRLLLNNLTYLLAFLLISLVSFLAMYKKEQKLIEVMALGLFTFQLLFFISGSIQIGQATGMEISSNWYDALDWLVANSDKDTIVATWWDPGHILAGYSYYKNNPFKVMADGAHCNSQDCIIYNHDIRIRDMGRAFSTNNETEAVEILKKYTFLSQDQCQKVKETFGDKIYDNVFKEDPCKAASKMYVIASSDLIGKYYWLSYFGSYDYEKGNGEGRNFIQLQLTNYNQQKGILEYGNGIISLAQRDNKLVPIFNFPQQGIRNAVIRDLIYFQQGRQINQLLENATINGLVYVDPSFQLVIFMDESIEKSIFTNMFFFNGEGLKEFGIPKLEHFELRHSNPEVKIFEIVF